MMPNPMMAMMMGGVGGAAGGPEKQGKKCEQLEFDTGLAAAGEKKEEPNKVESPGPWRRFTSGHIGVLFACYRGP